MSQGKVEQSFAKKTYQSQRTTSFNNTRDDSKYGFQQMVNTKINFIMFFVAEDGEALQSAKRPGANCGLEEPDIKLPTSAGSQKKQENSRKASTFASLTKPKPLTLDHNKLWKILKQMGIPDHLTCLLRNLCAGQEATVRRRQRTTDWFQTGKGACQGCMLSPY